MPNYTSRYRITKPLPTDLYDIGVYNTNMDTVDKALADLDDSTYSKEEVNQLIQENKSNVTVDHTVTSNGTNPVSGKAVSTYVTNQLTNVNITVDQTVSATSTNAVSGKAVVTYAQPKVTYSTTDLNAGTSKLNTGEVYLVYE